MSGGRAALLGEGLQGDVHPKGSAGTQVVPSAPHMQFYILGNRGKELWAARGCDGEVLGVPVGTTLCVPCHRFVWWQLLRWMMPDV